jgi:hypothetical protein
MALCQICFPFLSDTLTISGGSATLKANEIWGALWGMETFTQLVYQHDDGQVKII